MYRAWLPKIVQWARAFGGAPADLEDIAHDVFLVVRRKLDDFDGENLPGWLYRITKGTVRDYRRRAWFRHVTGRPVDVILEEVPEDSDSPDQAIDYARAQRTLYGILDKMSDKRRTAFVLFEIEGYSGEEIAALEGVPVGTVWTRLHGARKEFVDLVAEHRAKDGH